MFTQVIIYRNTVDRSLKHQLSQLQQIIVWCMFQRKESLEISAAENSHETPRLVFLNEKKKCHLLQILLGALRVKITNCKLLHHGSNWGSPSIYTPKVNAWISKRSMWSRLPGSICPGEIGFLQSSFYEVMWSSLIQLPLFRLTGLRLWRFHIQRSETSAGERNTCVNKTAIMLRNLIKQVAFYFLFSIKFCHQLLSASRPFSHWL